MRHPTSLIDIRPSGGNAPAERGSTPSIRQVAHAQVETLVLLPRGTIYPGTQRNTIDLLNVQTLLESITLYRMDVNMQLWRHEKDTNDHPLRGARPQSDCSYQGVLWSLLRQRRSPLSFTGNRASDLTARRATPAPNKERFFIPRINNGGGSIRLSVKAIARRPPRMEGAEPMLGHTSRTGAGACAFSFSSSTRSSDLH